MLGLWNVNYILHFLQPLFYTLPLDRNRNIFQGCFFFFTALFGAMFWCSETQFDLDKILRFALHDVHDLFLMSNVWSCTSFLVQELQPKELFSTNYICHDHVGYIHM